MIRVIEDIYRDYENPRRAELNLQAFLNDHPDENDWDETDYERYYDLKDRVRFAWDDDEFDSMYESYDKSKYSIKFFTQEEYERLQDCVSKNECGSNNTFGYITDGNFAVDVICEEVDGIIEPEWNVYKLIEPTYNDFIEGGTMDLSLSYEKQVEWLIKRLEDTVLGYDYELNESKLTESDFTGDPLLPDVKDVYEELIRMYDVRKDVGYVETVKKMLASIGGKANVNAFRSNTFGDDRMVIDWIVKDGEFKYTGRSYISDDSYGQWLFFIEDLCMAYYKSLGGKGGYTPDLIKAIGKGY